MKRKVIQAKIDAIEYLKEKSFGIDLDGQFVGVIEIEELDKELRRLYAKLEGMKDEDEFN